MLTCGLTLLFLNTCVGFQLLICASHGSEQLKESFMDHASTPGLVRNVLNLFWEQDVERCYVEHGRCLKQSNAFRRNDRELAKAESRSDECAAFVPEGWPMKCVKYEGLFTVPSFGNDKKLLNEEGPYIVSLSQKIWTCVYYQRLNSRIGRVTQLCKHLHLVGIRYPKEATIAKLHHVSVAYVPMSLRMQNPSLQLLGKDAIENAIVSAEHPSIDLHGDDTPMLDISEVDSTDTISADREVKESYSRLHSALKNTCACLCLAGVSSANARRARALIMDVLSASSLAPADKAKEITGSQIKELYGRWWNVQADVMATVYNAGSHAGMRSTLAAWVASGAAAELDALGFEAMHVADAAPTAFTANAYNGSRLLLPRSQQGPIENAAPNMPQILHHKRRRHEDPAGSRAGIQVPPRTAKKGHKPKAPLASLVTVHGRDAARDVTAAPERLSDVKCAVLQQTFPASTAVEWPAIRAEDRRLTNTSPAVQSMSRMNMYKELGGTRQIAWFRLSAKSGSEDGSRNPLARGRAPEKEMLAKGNYVMQRISSTVPRVSQATEH